MATRRLGGIGWDVQILPEAAHATGEGEFTLADIAYAPHLSLVADGGYDFAPYPRLGGWLARLRARPAWRGVEGMIFDTNR